MLRWSLLLVLAFNPASARAQSGGLGVSTAGEPSRADVAGSRGRSSTGDGVATERSRGDVSRRASSGDGSSPLDGSEPSSGEEAAPDGELGVSTEEAVTDVRGNGAGEAPPEDGPARAPEGAEEETEEPVADDASEQGGSSDDDESEEDDPGSGAAGWTEERAIGWAVFGSSVAVGVLGAVLLAVGVDERNTAENAPGGTSSESVAGVYERASALTATGAVLLGLGIVGTAVGAAVLAVWGAEGTWLEVSAVPGALRVCGRF